MKIEKIQKLKNNKYKIKLDSGDIINTYDDVILNNSLLFNKEIDLELLNKINNETLYYDCYNKTLKFIDKKLRSEKEIKEYLKKYSEMGYEDKILKKLKEINMINDENYAKAYISDRIFLSTDGPNKIKQELFNYGIDEKIIEENINKIALSLVIGGSIGNLIDRIVRGAVVDFLDFKIFGYNYPIFNLADTFIVLGVFLLLISMFRKDKNNDRRHK